MADLFPSFHFYNCLSNFHTNKELRLYGDIYDDLHTSIY